uniref:Transmembrane p24 trafficking protein 9 n=1 Tax=Molossus molossus TaxID=27622 RepID=A0A7J8IDM4_MOLMO|nr:transmembrane p24 trafficking protein 9 [Molossus molossus]
MAVEQCVRVVGPCPGVGMRWMVRTVLLLLWFAARGGALYFHIGETEKKCFIEEIPDETMVIGNYRTQLYDKQREEYQPATPGLGMFVEVKDPEDKVILARQYGSEGRFTFTSHTPGEHQICLHSNSTKFSLFAGGMLRVHLDIQVGEHANDYAEIAAKDKLSELQLRVRQLVEQVEQIQKEQNYQRVSGRCDISRASLKPRSWCSQPSSQAGGKGPPGTDFSGRRTGSQPWMFWRGEGSQACQAQAQLANTEQVVGQMLAPTPGLWAFCSNLLGAVEASRSPTGTSESQCY